MNKETPKGSNYGFDVTTVAVISAVALTIGLIGALLLHLFDPKPGHGTECEQVRHVEKKFH